MEMIEVDGLRIAYERAGAGPPLVLLHGYVGDGRSTWRRQIEELGDEFTVVAWDAPGVGRSADPPESFGMAGYALRKLEYDLAPFVIALVLAPLLEQSLRQSLVMSPDGAMILVQRPVTALLLAASAVLAALMFHRKSSPTGGGIS